MWRKDEQKSQGTEAIPPAALGTGIPQQSTPSSVTAPATGSSLPLSPHAAACITQGIRIKGDVTGKEDLFIDGTLEGKLELGNASCTVGPNGKVKADITAREVIVRGQVDGKLDGKERVQLWNSGRVSGEVRTERLAIEDGAILRGKVEAGKPNTRSTESKSSGASSSEKKPTSVDAGSRAAVI